MRCYYGCSQRYIPDFLHLCFFKGQNVADGYNKQFQYDSAITASFIILDEEFGILKIAGTVLALISFVLNVKKENPAEKSKLRAEWLFFTALVFFSNGLLTINQKLYSAFTKELQVFEFVAVTYITASLLSLIILISLSAKSKSNVFKKPKGVILSGCAVGLLLGIFQRFNTYAASLIDGTVLYSVYNCGVSLLSVLTARIFLKEKLSAMQYAGVIIGTVAIIFLCI